MLKYLTTALLVFMQIVSAELKILTPKAPPSLPLIIADESGADISLNFYNSVNTEVIPKIIQKKDFIYVLPANVAAKLHNKGVDIKFIGAVTSGLLSVLSSDSNVKDINDLNNKTFYSGARGSSPDVISSYIFNKNNISPDFRYASSPEIARLLISGKIKNCVLPEPLASMAVFKNKKVKRISILKNEFSDSKLLLQAGLFASSTYLEKNRNKIKNFLKKYRFSVKKSLENKSNSAKLLKEKLKLKLPEKVINEAIPNMNLVFIPSNEAKKDINEFINSLYDTDKKSTGGKVSENFFWD